MIHASSGVFPPGMAHDHSHHLQGRNQPEMNLPATDGSRRRVEFEKAGRFEGSEPVSHESDTSRRAYGHDDDMPGNRGWGHGHHRFGDVVGAAVFAHRMQMEQRAEFRAEMHDIRHDIRDLMEEVEGGQLTAEQQVTFGGYVQDIVDLRESFDFKHWRSADADVISALILDRFEVEAAPSEAAEATDPATVDPNSESQLPTAQVDTLDTAARDAVETVSDPKPPAGGDTTVTTEEIPPVVDTATTEVTTATTEVTAAVETEVTGPTSPSDAFAQEDFTVRAERLAGVIADASALMDDLLEALGV